MKQKWSLSPDESLSKEETRRDGSNPFIVIKSLLILWNNVPTTNVLNLLNWILFKVWKSFDYDPCFSFS